jgi:hypothetical protein
VDTRIEVTAQVDLAPQNIAAAFWNMDAEQQADFFAKLEELAGIKLCFQMAAVVDEIRRRSERGDRAAMQGFQTMLAHAQAYAESATEHRVWEAQREIARMADAAMETTP